MKCIREKISIKAKERFLDPEFRKRYEEGLKKRKIPKIRKKPLPHSKESLEKRNLAIRAAYAKKFPHHLRKRSLGPEKARQVKREKMLGIVYWNDGEKNLRARECPGEGWNRGKLPHENRGQVFWTNGLLNKKSEGCPGEGWRRGVTLRNAT